MNAAQAHLHPPRAGAPRLLLFCVTILGAMGTLSEFPIRWFVRAIFALACLVAGTACLVMDRRAAGRGDKSWSGADVRDVVKAVCWLLLWCEVATLGLRFLRSNALPYFSWEPAIFKAMWGRRVVVVSHIAAGMLALLLGPAQFWPAWRVRALSFHRWTGRLYVLAVGFSGLSALYLARFVSAEEGGPITGFSMGFLGLVWMGTTATGWRMAVTRRLERHREWMFRSYLLTLVFITLRWPLSLPWVQRLGPLERVVPVVVWTAWLVPLALGELAIRRARAQHRLRFV
ncbi:MAG TPA: DUF2306 domain-containing protein [Chthoniobacteraceae bacterium]|nr:DUF2306 domain-containing protein [Chthoniobacteraceae bacterium]